MKYKDDVNNYSIIICDDDGNQAKQLEKMIRSINAPFNTRVCTDMQTLYAYIDEYIVDAVFLDIKMDNDSGIDVGMKIKAMNDNIKIIFVSGYPQYIHDIFDIEPSFFLLKPVTMDKLEKAIHFAFFREPRNKNTLEIKNRGNVTILNCDSILFIESHMRTIIVHCIDGRSYKTYSKLTEMEKKLPREFIRCHQSYIINATHVKSLNQDSFILKSEESIPISQRKAKFTKDSFFSFLQKRH